MFKIIIFGSSGFVGSNIHESLDQEKYKLFLPNSKECDLMNLDAVRSYIKKVNPDIIINAAFDGVSKSPPFSSGYVFNNIKLITNILEGCNGVSNLKKIIHFGSAAEYGDSKEPISEVSNISPKKIYGTAKAVSTLCALEVAREHSLPLIVLRLFYLYGPGDNKSVLHYLVNSLLMNKEVQLTRGEQIRDYMFIKDLAHVVLEICKNPDTLKNGEIYNIGTGKGIRLFDMYKLVYESLERKCNYKLRDYSSDEYFSQVADIKKIKSLIKIKRTTSIKKGIKSMVESMKI